MLPSRIMKPSGYFNGTDALRQLMKLQDTEANIIKISAKDYTLKNGVDYCYVIVEYKDGTNYSLHGYGNEARELHKEATMIMSSKPMLVSPQVLGPLK